MFMRAPRVLAAFAIVLASLRPALAQAPAAEASWFDRVLATKEEQPRWMTPLVTVTPRLEQEFRYDVQWRRAPDSTNYGVSKGLELIPAERIEVIVGVPPYLTHASGTTPDGFGDLPILVKYRIWASPETQSNAIVTAFLGATLPTGHRPNGAETTIVTPTIAAGKGWGRVDVQSTAAIALPADGSEKTAAWNTALQYRLGEHLWPEVEANATWFTQSGRQQTFITPGVIVGRFRLPHRVGLAVGAGVGFAASRYRSENRRWTVTLRLPFPI